MCAIFSRIVKSSVFLLLLGSLWAQTSLPELGQVEKTVERLSKEKGNESLVETWTEILQLIKQAHSSEKNTAAFEEMIQNAPGILEEKNAQLEAEPSPPVPPEEEANTIKAIEAKINEKTAKLKAEQAKLAAFPGTANARADREKIIPVLLASARTKLGEITLPTTATSTSADPTIQAQNQLALAKHAALTRRITELETELRSFLVQRDLELVNRQLAVLEVERLTKTTQEWNAFLEKKSNEITANTLTRTKSQIEQFVKIPALVEIAKRNSELAGIRASLNEMTAKAREYRTGIIAQRLETNRQRLGARTRIQLLEEAGLNIDTKTGSLLRLQRASLPSPRDLKIEWQENVRMSTTRRIERLELEAELEAFSLTNNQRFNDLLPSLEKAEIDPKDARELFNEHRTLLTTLIDSYGTYISVLENSIIESKKTILEIETYALYLDQRLFWIRSAPPISFADITLLVSETDRIFSPAGLPGLGRGILKDIFSYPHLWIPSFIFVLVLFRRRKRHLTALAELGTIAERKSCQSFLPTLQALYLSILLTIPFPFLFWFAAWRGHLSPEISDGFRGVAFFMAGVGFFKIISRPKGILTAHLGMPAATAKHLAKHLRWFYFFAPLFIFLLSAFLYETPEHPQAGRIIFIIFLIASTYFIHSILLPSKNLIKPKRSKSLLPKLAYGIGIIIPITFIFGVSLGYISSVKTLRHQTLGSALTIIATLFVVRLLLRGILVSRRRLARNQAVAKYKATVAARQQDEDPECPKKAVTLQEIEADAINVVAVEEQTTRLVKVGMIVFLAFALWNIWATSLSALSALDKIHLWEGGGSQSQIVDTANNLTDTLTGKNAADSSLEGTEEDQGESLPDNMISLQDLLNAIVVIALTLIGARNIPGLLELTILGRLNLKPGANYAFTTVLRYMIIAIGFVIAFGLIGITWTSVQWLAAAVTLGIGFGLQEIFANFVAGIILLFERPIRLGDVVTVGEVNGRVSEIKIRATTIRQFNNRELVVPNKEFITGKLVNWTLSDNILRFEFVVGIAYGSDTKKATDIIYKILEEHPDILKSHPPVVLFTAFGSSTLDLEVRAFVKQYDRFPEVQSQLHFEIDKQFRKAGIEIAFPQTDIHIRSMPEAVQADQAEAKD